MTQKDILVSIYCEIIFVSKENEKTKNNSRNVVLHNFFLYFIFF